jgi:hypothetical protein
MVESCGLALNLIRSSPNRLDVALSSPWTISLITKLIEMLDLGASKLLYDLLPFRSKGASSERQYYL